MIHDDNVPQYRVADIAEAIGMPANTIRTLLQRGHMRMGEEDTEAERQGESRRFTRVTARVAAIACEAMRHGVVAPRAFDLADAFRTRSGRELNERGRPRRKPGQLYPTDMTYLVSTPDGPADVINVTPKTRLDMALALPAGFATSVIIIDCGRVVAEVDARLAR